MLGHVARNGSCSGSALALELVEQGHTPTEAARQVGVTDSAVSHARRRASVGKIKWRVPSLSDQAAEYLRIHGGTLAAAGERFGISRQSVQQGLKRAQWIAEVPL